MAIKLQYFTGVRKDDVQNTFNGWMEAGRIKREQIVKIYSTAISGELGITYILTMVYEE